MNREELAISENLGILIVEDNAGVCRFVRKRLERENYTVYVAGTGKEAVERIIEDPEVVLLLDYKLPDMTGRELIYQLSEMGHSVPFIIITGHGDEKIAVDMMKLGARDYLVKDHKLLDVLPQVVEQVSAQVSIERKLQEVRKALKESESRYEVLFNSSTDIILVQAVIDGEPGCFVEVNDTACVQLGFNRDELLTMSMNDLEIKEQDEDGEDGEDEEPLPEKRRTPEPHKPVLYESIFRTRDGGRVYVENNTHLIDLSGKPVIFYISRDISQRNELEAQLRQAQKMEAIGKLAGGVAHDFNNLLTAIMGYSDLMLVKMPKDSVFREGVKQIKKAGERAAALTQQLLAFSRKQMLKPRVVNLNQVVNNMKKMLTPIIGENIHFDTRLDSDLNKMKADSAQVEQVILNLTVNARDAMLNGGSMSISTFNQVIDEHYVRLYPYARAGQFVCLSISDSGHGIDQESVASIFEPFYTTKKSGTGLGLSVVYGIIKQHNGWINVYSQPGQGTTFDVFFPVLESHEEEIDEEDVLAGEYQGNGECIMVVEDEIGVRHVTVRALLGHNYEVLEAGTAEEARRVFEDAGGDVQLLLSDIVLPDQNGIKLSEDLQRQFPEVKILLTSGYADQQSSWTEVVEKGIPFLQKPYSITELLKIVKEVLEK